MKIIKNIGSFIKKTTFLNLRPKYNVVILEQLLKSKESKYFNVIKIGIQGI